jgi:MATE family multidrug resistance protein
MTFLHHIRRTLALGLPLAGAQVAQVLIGVTDTLMLGRYSVEALAAATLAHSLFFSLFILGSGFAYAVMPMAASAAELGDATRVRRATRMGMWLSAIYALAVLPLTIFSGPILRAMGQAPDLAADAQAYLRIAGFGLMPFLILTVLRSHLSALERARPILYATLAAVVLNAAINWLLIFGNLGAPELGLRGAAIASVAVQVASAAALGLYAARGPGMAAFEIWRNPHRPDWPAFAEIFRLGWPIGLTHLAETSLFAASALMMGWLGTVPLAAHGIAIQIASMIFVIHLGLASAGTVRVGQAFAARDRGRLGRAAGAAALVSGLTVLAATALYLGAGRWMVGLFIGADDPQAPAILAMGATLLIVAALFQLVDAGQVMALGFLRGMQDTRVPMIYAIGAYWALGIPASWLLGFPLGLGPVGIWLGLVIGLAAAAAALTGRFLRRMGRLGDGEAKQVLQNAGLSHR